MQTKSARPCLAGFVVAIAIVGTALPAFAGHVVSPILTETSPSVWWDKNKEEVLKDVMPDAEAIAYTNDGRSVIPEQIVPLRVPEACIALVEDEMNWSMAGVLLRDVPRGSDDKLAGRMQTFLLACTDRNVHKALKMAEFFKNADGELEDDYAELCLMLGETDETNQLVTALRNTPAEDGESLSKYMRRIKKAMDGTNRSVIRKGLSGLESVAARLAAIATVYTERLASLDRQFTTVVLPTTAAEMQDMLYLVTQNLGDWAPVYVESELMDSVRIKIEANVGRYISDRRKAGDYPSAPWPGFMEALTDKLSDAERVEANLLARRALIDLAKVRVAHDAEYHKAVSELRAIATFLTLIAKRDQPVRTAPTPGRPSMYAGQNSIERTVIDCVMVMRFVTPENDDILNHYYSNTAVTPSTPNSAVKFSCKEIEAVAQANHVLTEIARYKPSVVVPVLNRTLEDERKRIDNAGKLSRDDLVFESNWSSKYTEFTWTTPRDFRTRVQNTLDIATGGDLHRKSGAVARLTSLPQPMIDGVVITD